MKACARKFYDEEFEKKLNSNLFLLGFTNGVYDLKNNKFRAGLPDDYVSLTTGYSYEEFSDDHPLVIKIINFFEKVQTNKKIRDFLLKVIASCLDGRIREQHMLIWTGSGCHSKDTLIKMFDGTNKKVQDIKIADLLLGDDGRERKVHKLFTGNDVIYQIKTNENIKFKVNSSHRLALKCMKEPYIEKEINDIYNKEIFTVYYYENIKVPLLMRKSFSNKSKAKRYLEKIKETCIRKDEIIPVNVEALYDTDGVEDDWKKDFNMLKQNDENGVTIEIKKYKRNQYYGFEIDGNKRYVMANSYITYNSNGKSVTGDLIGATWGDYADTFDITVFTRKRGNSSNATPEIADKVGKRFMVTNEPEFAETLYTSLMKMVTSGVDKIVSRSLYEQPFSYIPQFKMFLLCNTLPNIEATDDGTWRRIRVIPWNSKFVWQTEYNEVTKKNSNIFIKDPSLAEEVKTWNKAFMWYLIKYYYYEYTNNELVIPEEVTLKTNEYKADSDKFMAFYNEFIDEHASKKGDIEFSILYDMFKNWYKEMYSEKPPNGRKFMHFIKDEKKYIIENRIIRHIALNVKDEVYIDE